MRLYRICTQNLNYPDILDYLDKHFPDGYTVLHANGAWQGVREKSLVIEIIDNSQSNTGIIDIKHLCYWLKKHNEQNAAMLQIIPIVLNML